MISTYIHKMNGLCISERVVYVGHVRICTRMFMNEHTYGVVVVARTPELLGCFPRRNQKIGFFFQEAPRGFGGSKDCYHRTGPVAVRDVYTCSNRQQLMV